MFSRNITKTVKVGKNTNNRIFLKRSAGIIWPVFRALLLSGLCFIILYPLIFMVSAAVRSPNDMYDATVIWLPRHFTFDNLVRVYNIFDYPSTVLHTVVLNLGSSVLQLVTCAFTGYGFARFKFKGRNLLFGLAIFTIIIPPQLVLIPLYIQFRNFDFFYIGRLIGLITGKPLSVQLLNTMWSFYLPAVFANGIRGGLFILLFRQFFRGLPKDLEDAAYIDGCGPVTTFIRIMAPNAGSAFLTVFLFSIVWYWNDSYISSMFYLGNGNTISDYLSTLQYRLSSGLTGNGTKVDPNQIMVWMQAGCLLSIAPVLVMYIFLQKYFTEGIERSGLVT